MIWELLIKTFIPVSRIFGNEGDILIFSGNVRKQAVSNYRKIIDDFSRMSRFNFFILFMGFPYWKNAIFVTRNNLFI